MAEINFFYVSTNFLMVDINQTYCIFTKLSSIATFIYLSVHFMAAKPTEIVFPSTIRLNEIIRNGQITKNNQCQDDLN